MHIIIFSLVIGRGRRSRMNFKEASVHSPCVCVSFLSAVRLVRAKYKKKKLMYSFLIVPACSFTTVSNYGPLFLLLEGTSSGDSFSQITLIIHIFTLDITLFRQLRILPCKKQNGGYSIIIFTFALHYFLVSF